MGLDYQPVYRDFWGQNDKTRKLGGDPKYLYSFLFAGPDVSPSGIYYLDVSLGVDLLGWTKDAEGDISAAVDRLGAALMILEDVELIRFDLETRTVWVRAKFNRSPIKSPNHVRRIGNDFLSTYTLPFWKEFFKKYPFLREELESPKFFKRCKEFSSRVKSLSSTPKGKPSEALRSPPPPHRSEALQSPFLNRGEGNKTLSPPPLPGASTVDLGDIPVRELEPPESCLETHYRPIDDADYKVGEIKLGQTLPLILGQVKPGDLRPVERDIVRWALAQTNLNVQGISNGGASRIRDLEIELGICKSQSPQELEEKLENLDSGISSLEKTLTEATKAEEAE